MNSIFLRIYGGTLAVLVLVGLLGAGSLHWLNEERVDRHREAMAGGTFRMMAQALQDMMIVQRRQATSDWGRELGAVLRVRTFRDAHLEPRLESRLLRDQVLVRQVRPGSFTLYSLVSADERLLLEGEMEQIGEQLARMTSHLLVAGLVRYPADEQPERLAELARRLQFGFDMRLLAIEAVNLDREQRQHLDEGDTLVLQDGHGEALRVLDIVPGSTWVLQLGPLYRMSLYPPQLLLLIAALGLTLIGLTLYLLVRPLERRLLELEQAASHIAGGQLDVRVPDSGSDSVGRLSAAFNHMAGRLQRLLAIQGEMVSAVAHELRTPVARLRFGLEMSCEAASDEARARYLQGMDTDLEELDQLLDEMLVYIRLGKGAPSLNFTPVALDALIDQVIAELAPLRPEVELLRGPCHAEAMVDAEPRYLRRALINLVSNAMRHAKSRVQVRFFHEDGRAGLEVEDDGPGVPEADQEKIFTPFLRLDDSRTRDSGGHGLGLSIVRRVIYWHGGRVQVGRADLGGARFTLLWPARHGGD
ncbi:ATP-binding protein [Stutzerimonas kirkiae]|uniref:ATP-binding protein n=1 Tax=Stutzerimonas kirkiae TaxID=2211392 RepID=UPI00103854B6|nr:ATP-binding protein [Stutzerimonas kirkiae]TBV14525.1 two-component sensor histidine kinase [Stutzerimonas kirkiae]